MKLTHATIVAVAIGAVLSVGRVTNALAQDEVVRHETTGPNRALLRSGIAVFGLSYVPAVVVAASNSRTDDNYLYLPVAGPWLDLTHRNACGACDNETLNKALIITDGVFQGLGALQFAASFLFVETTTVREAEAKKPDESPFVLKIRPSSVSSGYGLVAFSQF